MKVRQGKRLEIPSEDIDPALQILADLCAPCWKEIYSQRPSAKDIQTKLVSVVTK